MTNVRLHKEASEVVAVVVGVEQAQLLVTTAIGSTKKLILGKTQVGSRAIKPRPVMTVGARNRITGAVRLTARPEWTEDEEEVETAVPQQLSFIDEPAINSKSKTAKKKKANR